MEQAGQYTIAEAVDLYLSELNIDKKKYFSSYLISAGFVYQDIFRETLWTTKSIWQPVKAGDPYNYIDVPCNSQRVFSVSAVDHCGNIQPLYYNPQLNIIPKPKTSHCGCTQCDCSGMCEEVGGLTLTTKLAFSINGVDYYEKEWMKYCRNGDILRYREVPTRKFNDRIGDGGDYNDDYNDDYLIGNPGLANFSIVTQTFQDIICKLQVRKCGCPEPTEANRELLHNHCSCHFPIFHTHHNRCCNQYLTNINNNHYGEVKPDECGKKIYVRNLRPGTTHLQLNFQDNGKSVDKETQIPDYGMESMFGGLDDRRKRFKSQFSQVEKQEAKYHYIDCKNKMIGYLNPLSWSGIAQVQDQPQKW